MKKLMLMEFPGEPKLYSKEEAYEYSKAFIKNIAYDYISMDCFSDGYDEIFSIALVGFTKAYNKYNVNVEGSKGRMVPFFGLLKIVIINEIIMAYRYTEKGVYKYNRRKTQKSLYDKFYQSYNDNSAFTILDKISNEMKCGSAEEGVLKKEMLSNIIDCINNTLTEEEQTIINMRLNDTTQSEIAKILGISQTTVSRRLKKITSKIEACTV